MPVNGSIVTYRTNHDQFRKSVECIYSESDNVTKISVVFCNFAQMII